MFIQIFLSMLGLCREFLEKYLDGKALRIIGFQIFVPWEAL
jgi:hypothetical protein